MNRKRLELVGKPSNSKFQFSRKAYSYYRVDMDMWEHKYILLYFISFFVYRIWKDGKVRRIYSFWIHNKSNAKYIKAPYQQTIYCGKREFKEKYKNNKWPVPMNVTLDLDRDYPNTKYQVKE